VAVAQEGDSTSVVAFAHGVQAFNEGRDQDALERFTRVVSLQPRNGTARYWLGLTLLRLGKPGEALTEIERSLRESEPPQVDPLWALHDLGGAQLAAGDAAAAERTLADVAAKVEAKLERSQNDAPHLQRILARARDAQQGSANPARGEGEQGPAGSSGVRRLERRLGRLESRLAAGDQEKLADELDELKVEADSRLELRRTDERLLARTLLRQAEALELLGRADGAAAARARAAGLVPELRQAEVVAPPWEGELPPLGVSARTWDASVVLTALGDSNPSLLAENLSLDTPDAGLDLVRGGDSDKATQLDLQLSLYPRRSFGGWSPGAAFESRQSRYQDHSFFDAGELQAVGWLARGGAPAGYLAGPLGPVRVTRAGERRFSFLFQGGIDHNLLDGSGYLTTVEGSASVVYRRSPRWAGQVDLQLLDRSYRKEPIVGRRSGTEARLGLSQTVSLGLPEHFLRLEVVGGRRSAGLPFASSLLRGTAELSLPLPDRAFAFALRASWQRDDYDNPESDLFFAPYDPFNPFFTPLEKNPTLRADTTLRASASLSWTVRSGLQLTPRFAWIDRDSNLQGRFANLDYRRTIVSLGASWLLHVPRHQVVRTQQ
jgi:tetratricopeptide (TPR) repeat protein